MASTYLINQHTFKNSYQDFQLVLVRNQKIENWNNFIQTPAPTDQITFNQGITSIGQEKTVTAYHQQLIL
jgi:hypothetical protein